MKRRFRLLLTISILLVALVLCNIAVVVQVMANESFDPSGNASAGKQSVTTESSPVVSDEEFTAFEEAVAKCGPHEIMMFDQ